MQTVSLSEAALALFRLHLERDGIRVDDANREAHRELARAGLMIAVHTFSGGREQFYRFTRKGWNLACASQEPEITLPSPSEFASHHQ
jgi:hypothetical protein